MANISGATNALPGAFTDVITQSRGVSIPGGTRLAAIIGEGSTDQTLISTASGGGRDGLNSTYSSATGADGRHFVISSAPLVARRTTLYKNGIPLVGLESLIDSDPFSYKYDYRIDIDTGRIELQAAHIYDQGGSYYVPLTTNVGTGSLGSLELLDLNAPPETWTIRCVSVQRTSLNVPIAGTAKFLAFGSVSGAKLDSNGNPIIWTANGAVVDNETLSFSVVETTTPFREGDAFTVIVRSGVLNRSDSLTANFIPTANLNDPVLVQGPGDTYARHGIPSTDNNLSLGAQLAFANTAPALITVQAAPPMPRRNSYILASTVDANSTDNNEFIYPLPAGVTPDTNASIHFFVTDNTTNVETQILPNKYDYYLVGTGGGEPTLTDFITDDTAAPAGYSYFYTVIESNAVMETEEDGYIARVIGTTDQGVFESSVQFDSTHDGKILVITGSTNNANDGTYSIDSVSDGKLYVTKTDAFTNMTNETSITFTVIDVATGNAVTEATSEATDGYLVSLGSATATFGSATVSFGTLDGYTDILTRRLLISGSGSGNDSLYDITAIDSGDNTITIEKVLVQESDLRFEVQDSSDVDNYVVVNKNVVPDGNQLRITLIDTLEASFYDAGWVNALESLETVECDIVVPLPKQTISVIFQNALNHCKTMSNIRNKKERVLFAGAINGLTPANLIGTADAAVEDIGVLEGIQGETVTDVLAGNIEDLANYSVSDAFGNTYRCVYFYPDQIVVQAGAENVLVDGFYIAAAAAGYLSAEVKIENPLTNKTISGFTILRNKTFSTLTLEQLATAGVCTLQPVSGGGRVVWGLTTTQSGYPEEQEISIVFIRDRVAKSLRAGFAPFVGLAETPDTGAILNTRAVILLNALMSQGLITDYRDLSVAKDSADPRQWNIGVRVQPTYPVNFIYIKIGLGQL
jgi:hypothetical protein